MKKASSESRKPVPAPKKRNKIVPTDLTAQLTFLGFSEDIAKTVCRSFQDNLHKALVRGEEVRLRGFGVLRAVKRKKRNRFEAEGGESVPADEITYGVRFKPSRRLVGFLAGKDIPETGAFKSLDDALSALLYPPEVESPEPAPEPVAEPIDTVPQLLPAITLMPAHLHARMQDIVFELPPPEPEIRKPDDFPPIEFDLPKPTEEEAPFTGETTLKMGSSPPPAGFPAAEFEIESRPEPDLDEGVRLKPPTLEDIEATEGVDFQTHYDLGISYKEMGLYEKAVGELQRAIQKVSPTKEVERYINCCSWLGMCYRERQIYQQSVDWFLHGLSLCKSNEPVYIGLRYELGLTYEMAGQMDLAMTVFSEVFALDVTYRSVAEKIKRLQSELISRQERMQKFIPVLVRSVGPNGEHQVEETWIVDISRKGAGLKTAYDHDPGTVLEVNFPQAARRHLGKVVWCAPAAGTKKEFRMGVMLFSDAELGAENWPPPLVEGEG